MGSYVHLSMQIMIIMAAYHVTSFTISGRLDDDTGLAQAISALYRHGRHYMEGYGNPDHLLNGGALSVEDVRGWLKNPNIEDESSDLNQETFSNSHLQFKDVGNLLRLDDLPEKRALPLSSIEPPRQDIEDIFDSSDLDGSSSVPKLVSHWLDKLNMDDGNEINKYTENRSNYQINSEAATEVDGNLSLNTLTKEEFRALLKAIDKLRKQSDDLAEKTANMEESKFAFKEIVDKNLEPETTTILQAVRDKKMELFHDGVVSPVTTETNAISQNAPETSEEGIFEKQIKSKMLPQYSEAEEKSDRDFVNELTLALQGNVVAAVEKAIKEEIRNQKEYLNSHRVRDGWVHEWGVNNFGRNKQSIQQNNKRSAAIFPAFINDLFDEDNDDSTPPSLNKFVARILQLEEEVAKLKLVSQLENLENDVLTDALNEASLGQAEESVSDLEFDSLKEAISIEEALQDLRKSRNSKHEPVGVVKRGQLWRQKRGSSPGRGGVLPMAHSRTSPSFTGQRATKEDMRRLLGQTYLMKDHETRGSGSDPVSFMRPRLGRMRLYE